MSENVTEELQTPEVEENKSKGKVITITSGKGGVGKTTTSANLAYALAMLSPDKKVAVVDFDVGTRNLDLILGLESRVIYTFVDYLTGKKERIMDVAIKHKKNHNNLFLISTSQQEDKTILTKHEDRIKPMIDEMREIFDYVIIDSPAGIEEGARYAMIYCDHAIVVCNPEVSSVRDADRMMGIIQSKHSSVENRTDVSEEVPLDILVTRYRESDNNDVLTVEDVCEVLSHSKEPIGIIAEDAAVLESSNRGNTAVENKDSSAGKGYIDTAKRILGEDVPLVTHIKRKGFFSKFLK